MHFSGRLVEMGACDEAVDWAKTMPDIRTAYEQCPNGLWFEWLLDTVSGWPEDSREKYSAKLKPIEDEYSTKVRSINAEYVAKVRSIKAEYVAKVRRIDAKYRGKVRSIAEYWAERKPIDAEYCSRRKPIDDEYSVKRRPFYDEYSTKVADQVRSLVPVEVFLKIFEALESI